MTSQHTKNAKNGKFHADVLTNEQSRTIFNILAFHSQRICFTGKNWITESKYNFLISLQKK